MQYLLLAVTVLCVAVQSVFRKQYNIKVDNPGAYFFSLTSTFFALLFFVVCSKFQLEFNTEVIPYAVGFAVAYSAALVGNFIAIDSGPLSLTLLINSYSLVIPTFHGIFAYKDKLDAIGISGLLLLGLSLFLINKKGEDKKFSLKWIISVAVSFIGNGFCSVFQKMEQVAFDGAYKNEFMIASLIMVAIFMIFAMLITKEKPDIKNATLPAAGCGIANGIVNMLVMVLAGVLPSVILYPSISAGGIVIGFAVAVFVYKERLTRVQLLGYVIGMMSIILLNI